MQPKMFLAGSLFYAAQAMLCLLFGLSVCSPLRAQNVPIDGHIAISLIGSVITQGEPIVLRVRVISDDTQPFYVDLGAEGSTLPSLLTMRASLQNLQNNTAPLVADYKRQAAQEGFTGWSDHRVTPGKWKEGQFVLTRRIANPPPGEYRLSVHIDVPCFVGEGAEFCKLVSGKPDDMLHKDETIALTILSADPVRLRQIAESLRQQIIVHDHTQDRLDPLHIEQPYQALFSLPEAVALPVWRGMLLDPHLYGEVHQDANKELVRLGTLAAGNLLVEAAQAQEPRTDNAGSAHFALVDFYANAPAAVKTQMRITILAIVGYL